MAPPTIEELKKSRGGYKATFTKLVKEWKEQLKNCQPKVPGIVTSEDLLADFKDNRQKYQSVQEQIEAMDANEEKDYDAYMKDYRDITVEIRLNIQSIQKHYKDKDDEKFKEDQLKVLAGTHPSFSHSMSLKLAPLDIAPFDGNVLNWPQFYSLFKSAVHDSKLPDVQKLHLLVSKLTGKAELYIQGLSITNDNYDVIWTALVDHYQNSRALKAAHLDQLFGMAKVHQDNGNDLQIFIDTANRCIRQIRNLKIGMDDIILHVISRKLDPNTRRLWEVEVRDNDSPCIEAFVKFIHGHARAQIMTNPPMKSTRPAIKPNPNPHPKSKSVHVATKMSCKICSVEDHPIFTCPKFKSMSVPDRRSAITSNKLCYNCFRSDHNANKCSSSKKCKTCHGNHHTFLHVDSYARSNDASKHVSHAHSSSDESAQSKEDTKEAQALTVNSNADTLLATAVVSVKDVHGKFIQCRALVDLGAQANFISDECASRLGIQRRKSNLNYSGVGSAPKQRSDECVSLSIFSSIDSNFHMNIDATVLTRITNPLPSHSFSLPPRRELANMQLADPKFNQTGPIDMLLGAAVYGKILREGLKVGGPGEPTFHNTAFGWIIFGELPQHVHCGTVVTDDTDACLRKFWEIEEINEPKETTEHDECEAHFTATVVRNNDGRYTVSLPVKSEAPSLGESFPKALARMRMQELRFRRDPNLKAQYSAFMQEYISLGHMAKIEKNWNEGPSGSYYLPHHAVLKKDSATTKCRVVFDGSCKTSTGVSLNDILMTGPTIQEDIFSLLTRFRSHQVAMCADITKMYRMFWVAPSDRRLQRILWRESEDQPMEVYELQTITYGTASAPFQAIRCLQQLAHDESQSFPLASAVTLSDFYVDNLLTGCATEEEALELQQQLVKLMTAGQLELRQWASNSSTVATAVNESQRDTSAEVDFQSECSVLSINTLGIKWKPDEDIFTYKINVKGTATTKREILSAIARIFDPLGWLSPVTILAKLFLKTLWKLQLDWDDGVPPEVLQEWRSLESQLPDLRSVKVPRCLTLPQPKSMEIHGFGDASKHAYGAVVYLRTTYDDNTVLLRMLASKTRVSPVKEITIPKLELCAAVLLAQLTLSLVHSLRIHSGSICLWSDSSVCLFWIKDSPSRWKPFVRNRVKKIQEIVPFAQWNHVPGTENPADLASRGLPPKKLIASDLWWNGPTWLSEPNVPTFPVDDADNDEVINEQRTKVTRSTFTTIVKCDLIPSVSSLHKLVRIMAWINRYISNLNPKKTHRNLDAFLSPHELQRAELLLVRSTQQESFPDELKLLKKKQPVHSKSTLKALNPYLDDQEIIRVGGRLRHTDLPESQKHPAILPCVSMFTKLLIESEHNRLLHAGVSLVLSSLHQRYWILTARNAVRHVLKKCQRCFRQKAKLASQLMGDLPRSRVNPSPPFLHTGVDYAGPIDISDRKGRGAKVTKGYIVLFVCMATKAIHLELATELTTIKFMDAFRRFISTRGRPAEMTSDCGTNFQGAVNNMKEVFTLVRSSNKAFQDELSKDRIRWRFNPSGSPHYGGLWEAGVKSVKYHLRRVLTISTLTYEDYLTVLKQIEAALNSRPLTTIPTEAEDPQVLTAGHFLIGRPVTSIPEEDYTDVPNTRLQRWALQQKMLQSFWSRWTREYLHRLQQRPKWWAKKTSLKPGDIVLITDERHSPNQWPLGRIIKVHPGEDQLVRAVTLKTAKGEIQRPIVKLAPLPFDKDEDEDDII